MGYFRFKFRDAKHLILIITLSEVFRSTSSLAAVHLSDLPATEGRIESSRFSGSRAPKIHGLDQSSHHNPNANSGEFEEMVPYVLASPDQEDAGSCLYMAITGIAEWWLAKLNPSVSRAPDGPLDLSERYIMNIAGLEEDDTSLSDWRTDSIYLFNQNKQTSILNSSYRFTKGWFLGVTYGETLVPSKKGTPGADYGTQYNWIDQRPSGLKGVQLPKFKRDIIFADPEKNQWNVGIAPQDIVLKVKERLRTQKAPVLVIYNQNSYWHAVFLVGYSDTQDNGNCEYTERFRTRIVSRAEELEKLANEASDPAAKKAYEIRAKRAREAKDKIERAYSTQGGCSSSKGVFFIRDSIYPDENGPLYDYDPSENGDEGNYSKKVVYKEYDWLKYFANHISVIYPEND